MKSPEPELISATVPEPASGQTVVVGVSGGVDSAVAAWMLRERGRDVVAVTTKNFCVDDPPFKDQDHSGSCCSAQAVDAARELCAQLGISHTVIDSTKVFGRDVIDHYVAGYAAGVTPSPCVRCNARVRFPGLFGFAASLGADWVATGHYARRAVAGGRVRLRRATDRGKDQSYYLHRVAPKLLETMTFPIGGLSKLEVREIAERAGLAVARTPDSQELCFVPDGNRRPLLQSHTEAGEIVDAEGVVLGRHEGLAYYTPGQRRGLGIAHAEPLYVTRLESESNRVVVGPEESLFSARLCADEFSLDDFAPGQPGLVAQTRARHPGLPVQALDQSEDVLTVQLQQPDRAPAPGQALVLYRGDVVVGGGTIAQCATREGKSP